MPKSWLRIEVSADDGAPCTVMFEPEGMTYELASGAKMFADVSKKIVGEIKIINITGGISIWAPGPVVTRDGEGNELHRLH